MRIKLTIEMCMKLLEILQHEKESCTDSNRLNQYPNHVGWVSCTRCQLLQIVQDDYVPELEFDLYPSIKILDDKYLIKKYTQLVQDLGVYHPETVSFFNSNKFNEEFLEQARIVNDLKGIV